MRIVIVCLILMKTVSALAATVDELVVLSSESVTAGKDSELFLYVHNAGEETVQYDLPDQLTCRISGKDVSREVVARMAESLDLKSVNIQKNGFIRVPYVFVVPLEMTGTVRMKALDLNSPAVMFAIAPAPEVNSVVTEAETTLPSTGYDSLGNLFSLYQPYLANIGAYKPMYFLVGADPSESRFQISLQYQLFNEDSSMAVAHPWLTGVHLGYTQTSIWNLKSASAPFEDTSYKPEVFFLSKNIAARPERLKGLFFQSGLQHESNGRGGEFSRSTNFYYFRPVAIFYDASTQLGLQVAPKVWGYVQNDDETNPDLKDYRGYFELEVTAGKAESFVLGSRIRWAGKGPSVQLDMTYPLDLLFFRNFDLYFQMQYVSSLAETLLNYHKRTDAIRFGFAIVR